MASIMNPVAFFMFDKRNELRHPAPGEQIDLDLALLKQKELVGQAVVRGSLPAFANLDEGCVSFPTSRYWYKQRQGNRQSRPVVASQPSSTQHPLDKCMSMPPIACILVLYLDYDSLKAMVGTCRSIQISLRRHQKYWDLATCDFGLCDIDYTNNIQQMKVLRNDGYVLTPPGQDLLVSGRGSYVLDITEDEQWFKPMKSFSNGWFKADEYGAQNLIVSLSKYCASGRVKRPLDDVGPTLKQLHEIKDRHKRAKQIYSSFPVQQQVDYYLCLWSRTRSLLVSLDQYGHTITRLHLDKIPFLNGKLAALIIEHCEALKKLLIDSCELMHVGKLIPMLNYIHWVGQRRGQDFIRFDFFPKVWFGPDKLREGTFVITHSLHLFNMQRAVLCTMIVAAMKAAYMGIEILAEDSHLLKFLNLVPMPFGLAHVFIKELCRFVRLSVIPSDRRTEAQNHDLNDTMLQVLNVMEVGQSGWKMYRKRAFQPAICPPEMWQCNHCGHHLLFLLFDYGMRTNSSAQRTCFPCQLSAVIDSEDHGWLREKRRVANVIFQFRYTRPEEGYVTPCPDALIAPHVPNDFVREPDENDDVYEKHWARDFASARCRGASRKGQMVQWFEARVEAWRLDGRNRFAEGLGMHLDNKDLTIQAAASESHKMKTSWEGIWFDNVLRQRRLPRERRPGFW